MSSFAFHRLRSVLGSLSVSVPPILLQRSFFFKTNPTSSSTPSSNSSSTASSTSTRPKMGQPDWKFDQSFKPEADQQLATFAAGCFWSVELIYQRQPGVIKTQVGYTGGHVNKPAYREVCNDTTGHAEAVQLVFDPTQISYDQLLNLFWKKHDPTQLNRQGNDVGSQYRSAIYYHSEEQKQQAEKSKQQHQQSYQRPIVTEIVAAEPFFAAESYHQQYLEKGGQNASKGCTNPIRCYG